MSPTTRILLDFLRFAAAELPALKALACTFFGCGDQLPTKVRAALQEALGIDLRAAGDAVNARIDALREQQKPRP